MSSLFPLAGFQLKTTYTSKCVLDLNLSIENQHEIFKGTEEEL